MANREQATAPSDGYSNLGNKEEHDYDDFHSGHKQVGSWSMQVSEIYKKYDIFKTNVTHLPFSYKKYIPGLKKNGQTEYFIVNIGLHWSTTAFDIKKKHP